MAGHALHGAERARLPDGPLPVFGIVTDCHYADRDVRGTRFYRDALPKLEACVAEMNRQRVDFLIELGDFKDQGGTAEQTLGYLREIEAVYARFRGARYHVLGNHDMDRISKAQFLGAVRNTGADPARGYYSFDCKGLHAVALDANFRKDGSDYDAGNFDWTQAYVPEKELAWLEQDLARTRLPVIVFTHQLLDADEGSVYVRNAAQVRQVLEASRRVLAVFQGHHHPGSCRELRGIHYYTLRGLIEGAGQENNAFAVVRAAADGGLDVRGHGKAVSRVLAGCGKAKGENG
ncbi:MAG TPA: metallophosphoesterase [Verrucomicrobiota bacterium]|nr:metallophosphoesterase [Verrucomicrobiota bacterium]